MDSLLCKCCKIEKPLTDFSKCLRGRNGYGYKCKLCVHEYDMSRKNMFDYSSPFYRDNKKVCSRCFIEKPLIDFTRDTKGTNGLKSHCNECRKPYYKKIKSDFYNPAVYSITNKTNGELLYIGETETPEIRKERHFCDYSKSPISKLILSGEINPDVLEFNIIEYVEDRTQRLLRETHWIKEKNPKYNILKKPRF